ncbi:MAG TPA: hypothetical protein DEQ02_06745 [Ruminococcaceae bacterium]|nr:hypothetical protein [Oscillospiraceae bacterium]
MQYEYTTHMVQVAHIAEYPTALGNTCKLLKDKGLSTYHDTEEAIMSILENTASDSSNLHVCMGSSHCGTFFREYSQGKTPFIEKEPIKLVEYGGRYWVAEGKHRICAAKQYGIQKVEAQIYPLEKDWYTCIAEINVPGSCRFSHTFVRGGGAHGEIAILWVVSPKEFKPRAFDSSYALRLDESMNTNGKKVELFPGLSYSIACRVRRHGLIKRRYVVSVDVEVAIEPIRCLTKIWLMKGPAKALHYGDCVTAENLDTVFRVGLWRNIHLQHNVNEAPK